MRRRQILQYWMSKYGRLSKASQQRFLRRQATARLAVYPDDLIRKAISWSNLLDDALSFAHSAFEGEQKPLPPEPRAPSRSGRTRRVAERGPSRDLDQERRLARAIGPVQNYEDEF
jgi:hypothetical protein